jgi:hypothetical protein
MLSVLGDQPALFATVMRIENPDPQRNDLVTTS